MSADDSQQVSLSPSSSRAPRNLGAPVSISKAARQVVPAFLQKLYEMVNDHKNDELIRWSDAGDSFFVLDHERFAHEVLGRWFKHRNFSSFVRQLNMYGFHKIPHLQQGVLKSDNDTEFWNFAHQNFHRGQPDLLCLIQRKKQATQGADDEVPPGVGGQQGVFGTQPAMIGHGSNQVLDFHSIVNGIAAIKRHQTTISAELNELKRSNQLLWQDAMAARTRHQQQQDTINRIVKFLAGVFGHHADKKRREAAGERERGVGEGEARGGAVERGGRGRGGRGRPLMIEDVRRDKGKGVVRIITEPMEENPIATQDADDKDADEVDGLGDDEEPEDEEEEEEDENPPTAAALGELYGMLLGLSRLDYNLSPPPPSKRPESFSPSPFPPPSTYAPPTSSPLTYSVSPALSSSNYPSNFPTPLSFHTTSPPPYRSASDSVTHPAPPPTGHAGAPHPAPSQPAAYPIPPIERPSTIEHPPSPGAMSSTSTNTRIGDPRESITITPYYPSPGIVPGPGMPVGAPPPRGAVHMSGLMPAATAVSTPAHMVGSPASVAATSPIMAPGATIMTGPSTVIQAPAPPVNMMVNPATSGPMEVMQPPPPIMDSISPVVSAAERPYPAAIPYVQAHPYYRYPQTQVPMYAHQYTQPMMQTTRGRQPFHHGATHAQMQQPLQHHQQQPRSNTPSPHAAYTGHTAASPAGSVRASSPPPTYDWDPRVRSVLNQLTAGQVTHLLKSLNSGTGAESQGGQAYGTSPYNYPPYPVGPSSSSITHPVETGAYGYKHYPFPPGYVSPLGAAGGLQQPYLHGQHMGSSSIASALGGPSTLATSSAPSASSGSGGGTAIPGIPGSENLIPMEDDDPDDDEHTRMWRVATDIDKDVNALNTSINQLIETFGLDPEMIVEEDQSFRFSSPLRVPPPPSSSSELASALSSNTAGPAMHPVGPSPGGDGGGGGGQQGDFDLHSFLSTLPSTNAATHAAEYGDIAAAASEFLDGVVSGTTSPILPATAIPSALSGMSGVGGGRMPEVQSRAGRKRKSDAVLGSDMEGVQSTGGLPAPSATVTRAANKTKRRKDKTR